jgi:hypothetical protein
LQKKSGLCFLQDRDDLFLTVSWSAKEATGGSDVIHARIVAAIEKAHG